MNNRFLRVAAAVVGPMVIWLAMVAAGPRWPSFAPVDELVDFMIIGFSLGSGFWLLARTFPQHRWAIGFAYFPLMLGAMMYLGVIVAFRLYPETF